MAIVKVKFFGVIRDVTGSLTAEIEVKDDATVEDLVVELRKKYGPAFADRVLDGAIGIRNYVKLFLNNEEVDNKYLGTTKLMIGGSLAEATIFVMPATAGG